MSEATLVRKIKKALEAEGACAFKIHGGQFSAGVPDLLVCHRGIFFGFEVKLPSTRKNVTELQQAQLDKINEAGGLGIMVSSVEEAIHYLHEEDGGA